MRILMAFVCLLLPLWSVADLQPLDESELQAVNAQAGLTLDVSVNFNRNPNQTRCTGGCGMRIGIRPGSSQGQVVLDNILGRFSFDGITLDIFRLNSGFAGEGAQFNRSVMKVGLQNARFENARFTVAGSNLVTPGAAGFDQHTLLDYQINGNVRMQGNLYIFASP